MDKQPKPLVEVTPTVTRWVTSNGLDTIWLTAGVKVAVPSNLASLLIKSRPSGGRMNSAPKTAFKCEACGATGEYKFSWDGKCLACEDEEPDTSCPICGGDPVCDYDDDDWINAFEMED